MSLRVNARSEKQITFETSLVEYDKNYETLKIKRL